MKVLHVLNGLRAAGIEALALQLIAQSPAAVQAELLNTNSQAQAQEQAPAFAELQHSGKLAAIHQWGRCDGPLLAWRTLRRSAGRGLATAARASMVSISFFSASVMRQLPVSSSASVLHGRTSASAGPSSSLDSPPPKTFFL